MILTRLVAGLALIGPIIIGFWRMLRRRRILQEKLSFAEEFGKHLKQFVESRGTDAEAYYWLTHRSTRMQLQMGSGGILAKFKPPAANYMLSNVPIVTNMLPEMRQCFQNDILNRVAYQYADMIQDSLVRHHGVVSDRLDDVVKELRSPPRLMLEGMRWFLAMPAELLGALGILPRRWLGSFVDSKLFMFMSGVVSLLTIIASIFTIVLGWAAFLEIVRGFWS